MSSGNLASRSSSYLRASRLNLTDSSAPAMIPTPSVDSVTSFEGRGMPALRAYAQAEPTPLEPAVGVAPAPEPQYQPGPADFSDLIEEGPVTPAKADVEALARKYLDLSGLGRVGRPIGEQIASVTSFYGVSFERYQRLQALVHDLEAAAS